MQTPGLPPSNRAKEGTVEGGRRVKLPLPVPVFLMKITTRKEYYIKIIIIKKELGVVVTCTINLTADLSPRGIQNYT